MLKPSIRTAKAAVLTQLLCTAIAMIPFVVAPASIAKSSSQSSSTVTEELIDGKQFCVSHIVVRAKPEAVWEVLADYANAPKVFHQLRKCQVVEDHGSTKLLKHQVTPSGLPGCYEYIVQVKEVPNKSLEWHRVSGAFKEVDGFWKLEPLEGGMSTSVTYSAYVNGGLFMPQPFVRRQFRIDMPGVMESLKTQAEGATQIAGRPIPRS